MTTRQAARAVIASRKWRSNVTRVAASSIVNSHDMEDVLSTLVQSPNLTAEDWDNIATTVAVSLLKRSLLNPGFPAELLPIAGSALNRWAMQVDKQELGEFLIQVSPIISNNEEPDDFSELIS